MTDAALSGDWETARAWHSRLFPLAQGLLKLDTNPIPIKTALALRGMIAEEFRLPICPMDDAGRARLETILSEYTSREQHQSCGTGARACVFTAGTAAPQNAETDRVTTSR